MVTYCVASATPRPASETTAMYIVSRRSIGHITYQHSTAGRAPSRIDITRTVPPGRSVAENPCNPAADPRGSAASLTRGGLHGIRDDSRPGPWQVQERLLRD